MDASNVPGEYALTILSECAAFPRRLVFFLKGQLEVSWRNRFQLGCDVMLNVADFILATEHFCTLSMVILDLYPCCSL